MQGAVQYAQYAVGSGDRGLMENPGSMTYCAQMFCPLEWLLNYSKSLCFNLYDVATNSCTYLVALLWGLNEFMYVKHPPCD